MLTLTIRVRHLISPRWLEMLRSEPEMQSMCEMVLSMYCARSISVSGSGVSDNSLETIGGCVEGCGSKEHLYIHRRLFIRS